MNDDFQKAEATFTSTRDLLWRYVASHSRRENMVINGVGHQYLRFDGCPLCDEARQILNISDEDAESYEVEHDSDPPKLLSAES